MFRPKILDFTLEEFFQDTKRNSVVRRLFPEEDDWTKKNPKKVLTLSGQSGDPPCHGTFFCCVFWFLCWIILSIPGVKKLLGKVRRPIIRGKCQDRANIILMGNAQSKARAGDVTETNPSQWIEDKEMVEVVENFEDARSEKDFESRMTATAVSRRRYHGDTVVVLEESRSERVEWNKNALVNPRESFSTAPVIIKETEPEDEEQMDVSDCEVGFDHPAEPEQKRSRLIVDIDLEQAQGLLTLRLRPSGKPHLPQTTGSEMLPSSTSSITKQIGKNYSSGPKETYGLQVPKNSQQLISSRKAAYNKKFQDKENHCRATRPSTSDEDTLQKYTEHPGRLQASTPNKPLRHSNYSGISIGKPNKSCLEGAMAQENPERFHPTSKSISASTQTVPECFEAESDASWSSSRRTGFFYGQRKRKINWADPKINSANNRGTDLFDMHNVV